MSLQERLNEDMKQAMRNKDRFKLTVIRMIRSSIKNVEINERKVPDDQVVLDILNRELKQRKESLQEFEDAGRDDLIPDVKKEIGIIEEYLPEQLSEAELQEIVKETIKDAGASSKADMGKVMSSLMPKVKGRADGKVVNQLVQSYLS